MADRDQEIRLKFSLQAQAVEEAEQKAQALRRRLEELRSAVDRGAAGWELAQREIAGTTKELAAAERQANKTRAAIEAMPAPGGPRLDAGKQSMLAFGLANMAQDAYYSPGAAINNAMFLAQMSGGVKELGKDLAALGGTAVASLKGVPALIGANLGPLAALGGAAAVAGAGFYALDKGLKDAGLSWEDFGDVVANTTVIASATSAVNELWGAVANTRAGEAVDSIWGGLKSVVHETANLVVGWDDATEAVRRHKEITEDAAKAAKELADAERDLSRIKSGEQKTAEARGGAFAQAVADLGGAGGIGAVAGKVGGLGMFEAGGGAITADNFKLALNAARQGDVGAQNRVMALAKMAGYDTTALADAQTGRAEQEAEAQRQAEAKAREEAKRQAEADRQAQRAAMDAERAEVKKQREEEARQREQEREDERRLANAPGEARRTIGALDSRVQQALVLGQLGGGKEAEVGNAVAEAVSQALQEKGMAKDEADAAGRSIVDDQQVKLRDNLAEMAMRGPEARQQLQGPRTIAAADFARNVQDGQDTQREIRDINKQMLEKLAAIESRGLAGRLGR